MSAPVVHVAADAPAVERAAALSFLAGTLGADPGLLPERQRLELANVAGHLVKMLRGVEDRGGTRLVLVVPIGDQDLDLVMQFLASTQGRGEGNTHGPLDAERLVAMLLQDVALVRRRPGSWEGANMGHLLSSHGYTP